MAKEEPNAVSMISSSTEITGNIITNGDIRIDGSLIGNISSALRIVLGEEGKIEGNIVCNNCEIAGMIHGDVTVNETLAIKGTANIHGNISANKLIIEQGAIFCGNCTMTDVNNDKSTL